VAAALEMLTDEECYLYSILSDKSGIDIAEFLWFAPEKEDLCWRAWPFQWVWWRNRAPLQIDQSSRSCGKSESIKARLFAFPFLFPNEEALITAPELNHLEPIIKKIEGQFSRTRLSRLMMKKPPTHRPFYVEFANGARIMGAIPQKTGAGVKGKHPVWLEQDEASDYPENGWTELIETLNRSNPDATWRAHGVTRGIRDSFYENSKHAMDEPALRPVSHGAEGRWTVHKIPAMARPTWTDEERQEKIEQYGSRDDPDYRRNVLGAHGDAQSPIFVMRRLMNVVDDNVSSDYNTEEYWHFNIKDSELEAARQPLDELIQPPLDHRKYKTVWMGMDVGYTIDPSEILIAAEYPLSAEEKALQAPGKAVPKDGASRLKIIGRVTLNRISEPEQAEAIMALIDYYHPKVFAMDSTGAGLPLFQGLQRRMKDVADMVKSKRARDAAECIKGYNFSSKILVEIDDTQATDEEMSFDELAREAGISRLVIEYSTDVLRTYVDEGRLWMPFDAELVGEFQGQTYSSSKNQMDGYGRRRIFSQGRFHALDAARMLALGHKQFAIEALQGEKHEKAPVLDAFISDVFPTDGDVAIW